MLFSCIIILQVCEAQQFHVKVTRIVDGDTFVGINRDHLQIKFRIWGIDAPEKKQPFGTKSKEYLSSLIYGKEILVDVQKQDSWGRYLTYVYTPENKDVSLEMIKMGMAWHYVKYDNTNLYIEAEKKARMRKIGLWSDPNCIAPWEYR